MPKSSDVVFNQICKKIFNGELNPGEKLGEAEIASELGISRGPLREAISKLEAKGLITKVQNVGSRVIDLTKDDIVELFRIREALEGIGAKLAAESIRPEEVTALSSLLDQSVDGQPAPLSVLGPITKDDMDFHFQVIRASKNRRLYEMLCVDLYYQLRLYRSKFTSTRRIKKAKLQHRRIFEAIEMRDGVLAEYLMRAHIKDSLNNALTHMEEAF